MRDLVQVHLSKEKLEVLRFQVVAIMMLLPYVTIMTMDFQ